MKSRTSSFGAIPGPQPEVDGREVPVQEDPLIAGESAERVGRRATPPGGVFADRATRAVQVAGTVELGVGLFADQAAHVLEGDLIGDAGTEQFRLMIVQHGAGPVRVDRLEL